MIAAICLAVTSFLMRMTRFGRDVYALGSNPEAATYLGITTAQLQTDLQAGKSLAQIADAASGKSAAGLESALVAAETAKLAAQVSSGALTSAQEQQILSGLTARIDALVQSTGLSPASAPSGAAPPAAGSGL